MWSHPIEPDISASDHPYSIAPKLEFCRSFDYGGDHLDWAIPISVVCWPAWNCLDPGDKRSLWRQIWASRGWMWAVDWRRDGRLEWYLGLCSVRDCWCGGGYWDALLRKFDWDRGWSWKAWIEDDDLVGCVKYGLAIEVIRDCSANLSQSVVAYWKWWCWVFLGYSVSQPPWQLLPEKYWDKNNIQN